MDESNSRDRVIIRTSIIGIVANVLLAAAAVYLIFHVSLEAWLGAIIALVIIKAGIEMLRETMSSEKVQAEFPGYTLQVAMDTDFTEETQGSDA